jgi:hypothetical protein
MKMIGVVAHTDAVVGRDAQPASMTSQDPIGVQRKQGWNEREGMFRGSTIRELTALVDAVMRTHKTVVPHHLSGVERMAPQVGLEPTTLRLTVARGPNLPFAENCDWLWNRWT